MAEAAVKLTTPEESCEKASYWVKELTASRKMLEQFHKRGAKIVDRFLDERSDQNGEFNLNLFHSNITTLQDTMYDSLPKIETSRRNADADDDTARVAATIIERLLNLDLASNANKYDSVLRSVLQDRLLPGLGVAKVRYDFETEEVEVPSVMTDSFGNPMGPPTIEERLVWEDAPVEYFHWQDILWGWARNFAEVPWIAYRTYIGRTEAEKRFPKQYKNMEFKNRKADDVGETADDDQNPQQEAEIWEIWHKESGRVYWLNNNVMLDRQDDPLGLKNFFPSPAFLMANSTTKLYRPTADYYLSQDLYEEIDNLQYRIATITEAVNVRGVYDANNPGLERVLTEGCTNDLIPVENWAMFAEKGGLKGAIDWFPLEEVVATLDKLRQLRDDTIALLQQVSGMADVQQGNIRNQYEGVGQTQLKAQFGSARIQALQGQYATFAADLMQLKAEVICKHFDPETIARNSNAMFLPEPDRQLIQPAIALLKEPQMAYVRITIRPETMAQIDYGRLKADRTEFLNAIATFMQSAAPMLQQEPDSMPYLLKILQWSMAGFKGSQEIEGVLDQAIDGAIAKAQQPKQPEQDPEMMKQQGEIQKIQAKQQADMQIRQQDLQADIQTLQAQSQARLQEIEAAHMARMQEITAKAEGDIRKLQEDFMANVRQSQISSDTEMEKDQAQTLLEAKADQMKQRMEPEGDDG